MPTKLIFTILDVRENNKCNINEENFEELAEAADAYYILVASEIKKLSGGRLTAYSSPGHLESIFRNMYFYLPYFGTKKTVAPNSARYLEAALRIEICSTFLHVAKESFAADAYQHNQLPETVFKELCRLRPGLYDEHYFQLLMQRISPGIYQNTDDNTCPTS